MGVGAAVAGATLVGGYMSSKASGKAADTSANASQYSAGLQDKQYWQSRRDLAPWRKAGRNALSKFSRYGQSKVLEGDYIPRSNIPQYDPNIDLTNDPSYQFRLAEQERGINRNMGAAGKITSGNRLEEIMKRSGQMASQEYAAADARNVRDYGIDRANENTQYSRGVDDYGRAYGQEGDYLNRLASLSNIGQTATNQTGAFGANAAANQGNALVGAANAQAAGQIGQANAISQGIGDLTSLATNYSGNQYSPNFNLNAPSGGSLSTTSGGYGGTGMGVWDAYG